MKSGQQLLQIMCSRFIKELYNSLPIDNILERRFTITKPLRKLMEVMKSTKVNDGLCTAEFTLLEIHSTC